MLSNDLFLQQTGGWESLTKKRDHRRRGDRILAKGEKLQKHGDHSDNDDRRAGPGVSDLETISNQSVIQMLPKENNQHSMSN